MMKSGTKFVLALGFSICSFFTSCSEEDILEELTGGCIALSAIENYSSALERFSNDQTIENCEALKAASVNYLRALDDCPLIEDGELEEALQNASEETCDNE